MSLNDAKPFERAILEDARLTLIQKALLVTDGTLTQLLEVFAGERIRVRKLHQAQVLGGPESLSVQPDEPVINRTILLRGERRAYLHAESWLVPSRMPPGMAEALQTTDTPIGHLWKAARLETFREIVGYRRETHAEVASLLGSDNELLSRSYLVIAGGRPMSLVVERFPAQLFT
jgi:chorismate-pyruvate lyase